MLGADVVDATHQVHPQLQRLHLVGQAPPATHQAASRERKVALSRSMYDVLICRPVPVLFNTRPIRPRLPQTACRATSTRHRPLCFLITCPSSTPLGTWYAGRPRRPVETFSRNARQKAITELASPSTQISRVRPGLQASRIRSTHRGMSPRSRTGLTTPTRADTARRGWAVENQATAGKGLPSDFVSPFDSLASETDAATA